MKRYFYFFFALFFSQVGLSDKWECISIDEAFSQMACTNIEGLKKTGIRLLNEAPKVGADNKLICFLHPKDTNGVLIELCQDIK